jgi:hypothetical protein
MKTVRWSSLVAALATASLLGTASSIAAAQAPPPPTCSLHLSVTLTPDVPNPRDPSFLDALAADPLFQLTWLGQQDGAVQLMLTGPGPEYRCRNEAARIGRDASVVDLKIGASGT